MIPIRFSHCYAKMPDSVGRAETRLLDVLKVDRELHPALIDYDVAYRNGRGQGRYPLPRPPYLVLLLLTDGWHGPALWTTIRPWTPRKQDYYLAYRGKPVRIVVPEFDASNEEG